MKKMNKKGLFGAVQQGGQAFLYLMLIIVLIGAVGVFGSKFVQDQRDEITDTASVAYQVGNESLNAMSDVASEQTTYSSAAILGIVLLILVGVIGYFVTLGRNNA